MRTFTMYRRGDLSATHDANQANPPDMPQFQGVVFDNGQCVIRWLTQKGSVSVWDSFDDMDAIHGHPEYDSEIVWNAAEAERDEARARNVALETQQITDALGLRDTALEAAEAEVARLRGRYDEAVAHLYGIVEADKQDAQMGHPNPGDSCIGIYISLVLMEWLETRAALADKEGT